MRDQKNSLKLLSSILFLGPPLPKNTFNVISETVSK